MQAIVYRRYSSDEQGDGSAQTLDAQLERCQSFAKAQGWTVVEVLTDEAKSAFTGDHLRADADLGRFISRLQDGEFAKGTILIADNLSRLSRRPVDEAMAWVHQVTGKGVEIGLADTREVFKPNPSLGDFLQTAIKFGVSHQASADKSDQTRRSKNTLWALAEQRKGKWVNLAGLLPRWLKRNATCDGWIVDEDMADTIVQIYKWSADGIGVNTIVNMLNARPDLPPFGRQKDYRSGVPAWSRTTVRQYLTSPIVEGDFRPNTGMFKGRVIHDFYPRIVDADTVARARADLKARRKVAGKGAGTGYTNLFAGITKCGLCGQRASLSTSVQKGKPYPYVRCEGSQEGRCTNKGGYAYRAFEATALDTFLDLALDDRFFEATGELGRARVRKAEIEKMLADRRSFKMNLLRSFSGQDAEVATVIAEASEDIARLIDELTEVEAAISVASGKVGNVEHLRRVNDIREAAKSPEDAVRKQARSKLRKALSAIVMSVDVERDEEDERVFTVILRGGMMAVRIDTKGRIKKAVSDAVGQPLYSHLTDDQREVLAPLIQRIEKLAGSGENFPPATGDAG
ncbi:recombinase family protein [Brevundimonas albigilva]|uniref:Recombinase family protein n=2 Tax=Pseudomonadota TaxID=1224 RepID=A0ABY4SKC0_9CAUL|nr:recombinase family protein [Brevundimonas albigilva]URI14286.1 recombinase family protein [Brevundimonas albigilva]